MTNPVLLEVLAAFSIVALGASVWMVMGRLGKLMLKELEETLSETDLGNRHLFEDHLDLVLGPTAILLCICIYFPDKIVHVIKWMKHKRKPKEKKYVEPQWDR